MVHFKIWFSLLILLFSLCCTKNSIAKDGSSSLEEPVEGNMSQEDHIKDEPLASAVSLNQCTPSCVGEFVCKQNRCVTACGAACPQFEICREGKCVADREELKRKKSRQLSLQLKYSVSAANLNMSEEDIRLQNMTREPSYGTGNFVAGVVLASASPIVFIISVFGAVMVHESLLIIGTAVSILMVPISIVNFVKSVKKRRLYEKWKRFHPTGIAFQSEGDNRNFSFNVGLTF